MNELFRTLYERMAIGIEECEKVNTEFRKHVECCFHISEGISLQVNKEIERKPFTDEQEAIIFYKTIRPKFTSLVEFYSLIYRAELFSPDSIHEKRDYWHAELERANEFLIMHSEFRRYIREGDCDRDSEYFVRKDNVATYHEKLIAQIMARELYVELLQKKLLQHT